MGACVITIFFGVAEFDPLLVVSGIDCIGLLCTTLVHCDEGICLNWIEYVFLFLLIVIVLVQDTRPDAC